MVRCASPEVASSTYRPTDGRSCPKLQRRCRRHHQLAICVVKEAASPLPKPGLKSRQDVLKSAKRPVRKNNTGPPAVHLRTGPSLQARCCSSTAVGTTVRGTRYLHTLHHGELPPTVLGAELPRALGPIMTANCMPSFPPIVINIILEPFFFARRCSVRGWCSRNRLTVVTFVFLRFDIPRQRRLRKH